MAQGDATVLNYTKAASWKKLLNLDTGGDTLVISLVSDATISIDGTTGISSLTKHNGTNYVDKTLQNQAVAQDDSGDRGWLYADDLLWTELGAPTVPTTWAVLWNDTVTGDPVLEKWEITDQSDGGDYGLTWAVLGLMEMA